MDYQLGLLTLQELSLKRDFTSIGQIVTTLVRRVTIDCHRELNVGISLNLLNLFNDDTPKRFEGKNKGQIKPAGIYPGRRDDS